MPQINFYTYLTQTTWTIIIFYFLYYILKQYLLPLIYEQIKLNQKLNTPFKPQIQSSSFLNQESLPLSTNNIKDKINLKIVFFYTNKWNSILTKITK